MIARSRARHGKFMLAVLLIVGLLAPAAPATASVPEGGGTPGTSLTVTPSDLLVGGQSVNLSGLGFTANSAGQVFQCTADTTLCSNSLAPFTTSASGSFGPQAFSVSATFTPDVPGPQVDCRAVSCVLRAETAAVAPKSSHHHLSFIGPPAAATGEASGVTADSATLHGTVTPNGASTSAGFEYSISPTLSPAIPTPVTPMGSGTAPVPVSSAVAGLGPATTYYFRAVASNAQGSRRGEIKSFTTAAAPAVAVAVAGAAAAAPAPGLGTLPPGSPGDGLTNCATAVSVGNNGTVKLCDATNPPTVSTSQTLTGTLPAKLEALAAKRKKRKKPRPAVLARGQTTIPAGETRAVELKLGAKHRRALARRGRVVVEAVIEATGPGGVTTVKKSVSLQAGKKKRKRG